MPSALQKTKGSASAAAPESYREPVRKRETMRYNETVACGGDVLGDAGQRKTMQGSAARHFWATSFSVPAGV